MLTYIGIGSNLGDSLQNCRQAIAQVAGEPGHQLIRCSPFYSTEPLGEKNQNWFINAAAAVETSMPPRNYLDFLLSIEKGMGRVREEPWGPRVIDLDLLFYGHEMIDEEGMKIPHPRLQERRFVLAPLQDIAPDWVHPRLHKTVSQLLAELKEEGKVIPLPDRIEAI
jgi:2-amino-4-hydroxy-6-hydroxymethyldihydropteridine diphosphokinase